MYVFGQVFIMHEHAVGFVLFSSKVLRGYGLLQLNYVLTCYVDMLSTWCGLERVFLTWQLDWVVAGHYWLFGLWISCVDCVMSWVQLYYQTPCAPFLLTFTARKRVTRQMQQLNHTRYARAALFGSEL